MIDAALSAVRLGSVSLFLAVVAGFVFLLLVPKKRLAAYLSNTAVRRFVEYFGNVALGDDRPAAHGDRDDHPSAARVAGRV